MGLRLRIVLATLALGASGTACASVIGLGDFEIVADAPDAAPEAGALTSADGSVTTADGITVTPVEIAFPSGNCADAKTATLTITNNGAVQTSYSATVTSSVFSIQDGDGYVAPGAAATITVTATGPTQGTAAADLTVTTGTATVPVHLTYQSGGGSVTASPLTVDFGELHNDITSSPQLVTFTNSGGSDVTVTALTGLTSDFTPPPLPFTIEAGQSTAQPFVMKGGTASPATATIGLTTDVPLCGTAPQLALRGTRTGSAITISPATVNLGDTPCTSNDQTGTQTPTATVTISNYGGTTPSYNVGGGGQFQVSSTNGTVPADTGTVGTVPLTVSLNAPTSQPQTYTGSFNVTVDGTMPTTATVQAQARVVGALFEWPGGGQTARQGEPVGVPFRNQGNVTACLSYMLTANQGGYFALSTPSDTIVAGGVGTLELMYYGPPGPSGNPKGAVLAVTLVACAGQTAPAPNCGQSFPLLDFQGR